MFLVTVLPLSSTFRRLVLGPATGCWPSLSSSSPSESVVEVACLRRDFSEVEERVSDGLRRRGTGVGRVLVVDVDFLLPRTSN